MALSIVRRPSLREALGREGFPLPEGTVDVRLQLPEDGVVQLVIFVEMTPPKLYKLGRALVRVAGQEP